MIQKPQESSLFPILPRVPCFSSYDREIQVRTTYGSRAIDGGTAYGKQQKDSASKEPLMANKESTVLEIFMKD